MYIYVFVIVFYSLTIPFTVPLIAPPLHFLTLPLTTVTVFFLLQPT